MDTTDTSTSVLDKPDVTDDADADDAQGVMVALLPVTTEWCKIDLPHLTLVYAGVVSDLKPTDFNELAKDAASIAMLSGSIYLRVMGLEVFGDPSEQVNVLKLMPSSELWAMRRSLEDWNASEFPFDPHVTIGPVGTPIDMIPPALAFDRIMVGWGEEYLTFWLKNR